MVEGISGMRPPQFAWTLDLQPDIKWQHSADVPECCYLMSDPEHQVLSNGGMLVPRIEEHLSSASGE